MRLSDYNLLVWQTQFAEVNQYGNDPLFRRIGTRMLCSVLQQILEFPAGNSPNELGIRVDSHGYGGPGIFDVSFRLRRNEENLSIHVTDTCLSDAYEGWVWSSQYGDKNHGDGYWHTAPVVEFLIATEYVQNLDCRS